MSVLPDGWIMSQFADIADVQLGKMLDKTKNTGNLTPYLRNINVRWGTFDLSDIAEMRMSDDERNFYRVIPGDLLVCEGGEPGRAAVWVDESKVLSFQKALLRVRPRAEISAHLLAAYLKHAQNAAVLEDFLTGTTIKHLPQVALQRIPIPLPPIKEQRRIVAKLDALFIRTRRAREELARVPHLLEHYKQALLQAAFTGELTRDWRHERRLADAQQVTVGELVSDVRYGTAQKCHLEPNGTAVLRIPNISAGVVDLRDLKYAALPSNELERIRLRVDDILVIRSNGSPELIGRAALVTESAAGLAYAGYLIRLRPNTDLVAARYLVRMLESPPVREIIETGARSTSGVHNINSGELTGLRIPCPSIAEQQEIVRRIEDAFAWLGKVADEHAKAYGLLPKLEAAILAKAFRGELVPPDPNEEPATVLLERIRAARATAEPRKREKPAAPPPKMKRKRKTKASEGRFDGRQKRIAGM